MAATIRIWSTLAIPARDKVVARLHLCDVATLCRCIVDIKIHEIAADDVLPLLVLLFSTELTFKQFIGGIYDIEAAVLFQNFSYHAVT